MILVCTNPDKALESEIPPDVRAVAAVEDVVITTHLLSRDQLLRAASMAATLGNRIIVDQELRVTRLDAYLHAGPGWFDANLRFAAADVKFVRKALPHGKIAVYDKCPSRNGVSPRERWTLRQYFKLLALERRTIEADVQLLEAYTYVATPPVDTFERWREWLDYNALLSEVQRPGAETWVLMCPWQEGPPKTFTPTPDDTWRKQLQHAMREGMQAVLFNPTTEGWGVVKELAPK